MLDCSTHKPISSSVPARDCWRLTGIFGRDKWWTGESRDSLGPSLRGETSPTDWNHQAILVRGSRSGSRARFFQDANWSRLSGFWVSNSWVINSWATCTRQLCESVTCCCQLIRCSALKLCQLLRQESVKAEIRARALAKSPGNVY